MRPYFNTWLLLFFSFVVTAQSNFPYDWLGSYVGQMYLENEKGISDSVWVDFDLSQKDSSHWNYHMSYSSEKWGTKHNKYELVWHDSLGSPSRFLMDEGNGIYLEEQFINNRFYGHYEVLGKHYLTLLCKNETGLYFEIRCTDPNNGIASQAEADENDRVFDVQSYVHFMVQYVQLSPKITK